jgi:hypothetical protein
LYDLPDTENVIYFMVIRFHCCIVRLPYGYIVKGFSDEKFENSRVFENIFNFIGKRFIAKYTLNNIFFYYK